MTRREQARLLYADGMRKADIARRLGVWPSTVGRWVDEELHARDLAASRRWKEANRGACPLCGGPTWHDTDGPCRDCTCWTAEAIIVAFRDHFDRTGLPPTCTLARHAAANGLPHTQSVARIFGSWNAGLRAAGLPVVCDRDPQVTERMADMIRAGASTQEVADEFGCTPANVHLRLAHRGYRVGELRQEMAA